MDVIFISSRYQTVVWLCGDGIAQLQHHIDSQNSSGIPHQTTWILTLMILKIFLAAVTDAWIFLAFPGSPAEMNMQVYCKQEIFSIVLLQHQLGCNLAQESGSPV